MNESGRKPYDRELEDYLAGRHPLSAGYRLEATDDEPAAALDAAVLGQARQAVEDEPPWQQPRWFRPLAAAAMLVLCIGLVMQVSIEDRVQEQAVMSAGEPATQSFEDEEMAMDALVSDESKSDDKAMRQKKIEERYLAAPPPAEPAPAQLQENRPARAEPSTPAPTLSAPAGAMSAEPVMEADEPRGAEKSTTETRERTAEQHTDSELTDRQQDARAEVFAGIRHLLAEDKESEARERLREWRENNPDAALPEDLRHLETADQTTPP